MSGQTLNATTNNGAAMTLVMDPSGTSFNGVWGAGRPWCGVLGYTDGGAQALFDGCGFAGHWNLSNCGTETADLVQIADRVTGIVDCAGSSLDLEGTVSDWRLNGTWGGGLYPYSWEMLNQGDTDFVGSYDNYTSAGASPPTWCGSRSTTMPSTCLGGGGEVEGTWYTEFGALTLSHDLSTQNITGSIWLYNEGGGDRSLSLNYTSSSNSWFGTWQPSPGVGEYLSLNAPVYSADDNGPDITGYIQDTNGNYTYFCGNRSGTLYEGCGYSDFWGTAEYEGATAAEYTLTATQTRGQLSGNQTNDVTVEATIYASVDGGLIAMGLWDDADPFTWYLAYNYDFTGNWDGPYAWCGARDGGVPPTPCFQP